MKLLMICLAGAACYGNPPPRVPRPELPEVVPGAELDVESHDEDELRPVTSRDRVCVGSDCSTVSVTHREHVTVKHASVTYNGNRLTLGQAQAIADPSYLQDWNRMQKLADGCRHAAVPKIIGDVLGTAGMLLVINGAGTTGDVNVPYTVAGGAAIAGGIAAYALGMFALGGQDCEPANELYQKRHEEWRAIESNDVEDELATELETVANQFNARLRASAAR